MTATIYLYNSLIMWDISNRGGHNHFYTDVESLTRQKGVTRSVNLESTESLQGLLVTHLLIKWRKQLSSSSLGKHKEDVGYWLEAQRRDLRGWCSNLRMGRLRVSWCLDLRGSLPTARHWNTKNVPWSWCWKLVPRAGRTLSHSCPLLGLWWEMLGMLEPGRKYLFLSSCLPVLFQHLHPQNLGRNWWESMQSGFRIAASSIT